MKFGAFKFWPREKNEVGNKLADANGNPWMKGGCVCGCCCCRDLFCWRNELIICWLLYELRLKERFSLLKLTFDDKLLNGFDVDELKEAHIAAARFDSNCQWAECDEYISFIQRRYSITSWVIRIIRPSILKKIP